MRKLAIFLVVLLLLISVSGCFSSPARTTDDKTTSYTLTVTIEGEGTVEPKEGTHEFDEGLIVNLKATPATNWEFKEWIGDVSDSNKVETTILVNRDKTVKALFIEEEKDSWGGEILEVEELDGIDVGYGTSFKDIKLPNKVEVILDDDSTMDLDVDWKQGDYNGNQAGTYKIYGDLILKKNITNSDDLKASIKVTVQEAPVPVIEYTLTVKVDGEGTVSPAESTHQYEEGTEVIVKAHPETGWQFSNWIGYVVDPDSAETTVFIDEDKTVTAVFTQKEYILTILTDGEGSVNIEPEKETYSYGDNVQLTAIPKNNWVFIEWKEDLSATANPVTITIDGSKTIKVVFSKTDELNVHFHSYFYGSIIIGNRVHSANVSVTNNLPFGVSLSKHDMVDGNSNVRASTTDPEYLNDNWINSGQTLQIGWSFGIPPTLDDFEQWQARWHCEYEGNEFIIIGNYYSFIW